MASFVLPTPRNVAANTVGAPKARKAPGLWRRWLDAFMDVQQRRAEWEIARHLGLTGIKFTDSAEREIEQRFLAPHRFRGL